jgi:alcohol dehydrogenase class IV
VAATHEGDIIEYVWDHPSVRPITNALPYFVALPTTAGTGSEATSVAVLDIPDQKVKSGISHRYLRPHQGIVDPDLTKSLPKAVTASCGLDVVCHAAESFISRPYDTRDRPESPDDRPPYQGSNPISDLWSAKALELGGRYLRRAVEDPDDVEARGFMMLGASLAGVGFGSAGVHIPHACSYPIAAIKHEYRPEGYDVDEPLTPHGYSVIVTAPAAFRFTYEGDRDKHHKVAELLTGEPVRDGDENTLPDVLVGLMKDVGAPSGVRELGYEEDEIDDIVDGAMKQQRLLVIAPTEVGPNELAGIVRESMDNW